VATLDSSQPHHHDHGAPPGYNTGTPDRLLDTAFAFWRSALLVQAHELGIFAELASGPRDAATLSNILGLRQEAAAAFLEALAALGMLTLSGEYYANTPDADRFLDPAKPTYAGRWLTMAHATLRDLPDLAGHLRESTGERQRRTLTDRMWADIAGILAMGEGV
jgi:hypothetical protein